MRYDKDIAVKISRAGNEYLLSTISIMYDVSLEAIEKYQSINGCLPNLYFLHDEKEQNVKSELKLIERLLKIEKIKRNV